jgi:hypothetical protein
VFGVRTDPLERLLLLPLPLPRESGTPLDVMKTSRITSEYSPIKSTIRYPEVPPPSQMSCVKRLVVNLGSPLPVQSKFSFWYPHAKLIRGITENVSAAPSSTATTEFRRPPTAILPAEEMRRRCAADRTESPLGDSAMLEDQLLYLSRSPPRPPVRHRPQLNRRRPRHPPA